MKYCGAVPRGLTQCLGVLAAIVLALGPSPAQGLTTPAPRSAFDLRNLVALDEQLFELATAQPPRTSVHAWAVRADHLVAYVESVDQARAELSRAGVDLGMVRFVQVAQASMQRYVPSVCSREQCTQEPMRGGLSWYTSRGECTTGFGATRGGAPGFLSAGHCAAQGANAYVGAPPDGTFYGEVARSVQTATTDASFVRRDPSYPSGSRGVIYVSASDPEHVISGREPSSGYTEGERSCISGHFSGFKCGQIVERSYTDVSNGLRDVVLVDQGMCGVPGDSGAPVFNGSTAMGIFTGALVNAIDPSQRCMNAVYHKLFHIESDTGARIITE